MRIVFASHSPFDDFLVVGSHHLARELSSAGHSVWHIGPPVTPAHFFLLGHTRYRRRIAAALKGAVEIQPGLTSIDPISAIPWQLARLDLDSRNRFVEYSNISQLARASPGMCQCDFLLIDDPRLAGIERILNPKALFYRPTDLYADLKGDRSFTQAERLLLERCDGAIATSRPVLDHVMSIQPELPSLLLTNGVDVNHFSQPAPEPADLAGISGPRAIYVGAVDDRFNVELMAHIANELPDVSFIIVGPGTNLKKLQTVGKPNIHVLGPRPYRQIPGYLQACNVMLMPLANDAANSGRSPMKLYESAAAGLPVVALATDEIRRRADPFVFLFSSFVEAVEQIRYVLKTRPSRKDIARQSDPHSWTSKASALLEFLRMSVDRDMPPRHDHEPLPVV